MREVGWLGVLWDGGGSCCCAGNGKLAEQAAIEGSDLVGHCCGSIGWLMVVVRIGWRRDLGGDGFRRTCGDLFGVVIISRAYHQSTFF